jgi:hypothetical protein
MHYQRVYNVDAKRYYVQREHGHLQAHGAHVQHRGLRFQCTFDAAHRIHEEDNYDALAEYKTPTAHFDIRIALYLVHPAVGLRTEVQILCKLEASKYAFDHHNYNQSTDLPAFKPPPHFL